MTTRAAAVDQSACAPAERKRGVLYKRQRSYFLQRIAVPACHFRRQPCHSCRQACHSRRQTCHFRRQACHFRRQPCHSRRQACHSRRQTCHFRRQACHLHDYFTPQVCAYLRGRASLLRPVMGALARQRRRAGVWMLAQTAKRAGCSEQMFCIAQNVSVEIQPPCPLPYERRVK